MLEILFYLVVEAALAVVFARLLAATIMINNTRIALVLTILVAFAGIFVKGVIGEKMLTQIHKEAELRKQNRNRNKRT